MVILVNRDPVTPITIDKGDRYAQILFLPIWTGNLKEVYEMPQTARGAKGFGSTGVNAAIIKKEITEVKYEEGKLDHHAYQIRK